MTRHRAPLRAHHDDPGNTLCPPDHRYTSSGKPLTPGCPGRAYHEATCSCGTFTCRAGAKTYVDEQRKRHLLAHRQPVVPTSGGSR
ncbi:hypothetical protein AB0F20_29920 [Streptomyces goshikiensis]|uniref:hypothetical protein n=1 Tax=Streptomyces goshikiensis TaxID=1942 RepID=UPI0033CE1ADC